MQLDAEPPGERGDPDERQGAPDASAPELDRVRAALHIPRIAAGEMIAGAPPQAGERRCANRLRVARGALQRGLRLPLSILLQQWVAPLPCSSRPERRMSSRFNPGGEAQAERLSHMSHAALRALLQPAFAAEKAPASATARLSHLRRYHAVDTMLIPTRADHHALAQSRRPMDMMIQGWSMRRFHAEQQWSTMSA